MNYLEIKGDFLWCTTNNIIQRLSCVLIFFLLVLLFVPFIILSLFLLPTLTSSRRQMLRKIIWFKTFIPTQLRLRFVALSLWPTFISLTGQCVKRPGPAWVIEAFMYLHSWHSLWISSVGWGFPGSCMDAQRRTNRMFATQEWTNTSDSWPIVVFIYNSVLTLHVYLCLCSHFLDLLKKTNELDNVVGAKFCQVGYL